MVEAIENFFLETVGKELCVFFCSMIPIIELRGAIPLGAALGLPLWQSFILSVVGNMLPVPFIIIFVRKVFDWIRRHMPKLDGFVARLEKRAEKKSDLVRKSSFWGLVILVAIPLPGTGAWTGALIAAMLEMRLKDALPAIVLGVVIAGILVALASLGVIHIL